VLPLLFVLLGVGLTLLFGPQSVREQPTHFWGLAFGVPFLAWFGLGFGRVLGHIGNHARADGWDEAREEDLIEKMARGRRSQQVLSVSLHTALREPDDRTGAAQLDAMLGGTSVLKTQPSRLDGAALCHSRLAGDLDDAPELLLSRALTQVLADLAQTLTGLPDDKPLALLLEVESSLEQSQLHRVWQRVWAESGIRQPTVPVEGNGLAALDEWLDQRINDHALLMVVAVQIAPQAPEGTAEAAVGVLFGNRLTQTTLPPLAYLHRPEQEHGTTPEHLLYAARQALDWVWEPLDGTSIEQVWRVGIATQRDADLSKALNEVSLPAKLNQGFCNLDASLGHPGPAAPWLAIAAATQTVQRGAGAQFTFSGSSSVEAGLWSTVLTPVPPPSK
jgi:hypothetical protein